MLANSWVKNDRNVPVQTASSDLWFKCEVKFIKVKSTGLTSSAYALAAPAV